MNGHVYRLEANFEMPPDDLRDFFDEYELPDKLVDVQIERRGNKLIVDGVSRDESPSDYTPTARLKASLRSRVLYEDGDDWAKEPPVGERQNIDDEIATKEVERVCFKGGCEEVLQNTDCQYGMYLILRDLARASEDGTLEAITAEDNELSATRVVDGEERDVSVELVDEERDRETDNTGNWRSNRLIG